MAEHTYKPKDVVSVRGEYVQSINVGTDRAPLLMHDVLIEADHEAMGCSRILQAIAPEHVAPHLSAEDQDALLRVARLVPWFVKAVPHFRCAECNGTGIEMREGASGEPMPVQCECGRLMDAAKEGEELLSALPDHLRARLGEEGVDGDAA